MPMRFSILRLTSPCARVDDATGADRAEILGVLARDDIGTLRAVGVATKWSSYEFFDVARTVEQNAIIDADMAPLFRIAKGGGTIVLPTDGLGTGLAELQTRAPATFDHLLRRMVELAESAA
jgi:hypothetical protein